MSTARDDILGAVRAALTGRDDRATAFGAPLLPARATGSPAELVDRFCEMARFAGATVERVASAAAVPVSVAAFLSRNGFGDTIATSTEPAITGLPWRDSPRLYVRPGAPRPDDRAAVTGVVAGVAETGTLLVAAGPQAPNALHFLCEAHIAVLPASDIVGGYEDALARIDRAAMPRAVTFITGPSRTADIEKTPQIGVHGPRQLHILVIDGEAAD